MNLALHTAKAAIVGLIVLGILVFAPAGTLAYWRGWAFIVVFTVATSLLGLYLARHDPALLERRLKAGPWAETRPAQKALITAAFAGMVMLPVAAVLDHRLGWSDVPASVSIFGDVLVALGLLIDLLVFRANSYGASTIRTMPGQTVVTTGPYALVRHPMYAGALVMLAGVPLALGSYWALWFVPFNAAILALRILDEEKLLAAELDGYVAYMRAVRYRLIPGLW